MLKKIFSNNYIIPSHYFIFIDQIVVSAGNFLLSIIILRFLGLEAFGIFSFYWLFLLLINGL